MKEETVGWEFMSRGWDSNSPNIYVQGVDINHG
jgi:hypothetical protein